MQHAKKSKTNEQEIELRKRCAQLHQEGKSPTEIHKFLQRTRDWVYKWIERFKGNKAEWYLDESKEPKTKPKKIEPELESVIVNIRQELVKRDTPQTRYAFHGSVAIHQRLDEMGYEDKPHLSTIQRVLQRNHLIESKERIIDPSKPKIFYPDIRAQHPGHIYELDLVTPRYITGYGRVVSVNRVDICTSQANLDQYSSKGADSIIDFVVDDWKNYAKPQYLKLDNEASFRGSLIHSRTFGKLTRFCLNFGVEIIFIPFNEPWRNPFIESFNSRFNERLWLFQKFTDLRHLRQESRQFCDQHNHYQSYRKEHFSKQNLHGYTSTKFPENFVFDTATELPITNGRLHFIRLVDDKGFINILNEPIYVNKNLCSEYVWSTINTADQTLKIFYQAMEKMPRELVKTLDYKLREPVKKRIPVKQFLKCR